jgi:hypothetical protein
MRRSAMSNRWYGRRRLIVTAAAASVICTLPATSVGAEAPPATATVLQWGENQCAPGVVPPGLSDVIALASGYCHALALRSNGAVAMWGRAEGLANAPSDLTDVTAIAAGHDWSLALRADGSLREWGTSPYAYQPPPTGSFIAIGGKYYSNIAVRSDGTVTTWNNLLPELYESIPRGLRDVIAVAGGASFDLALKSDGTVVGWGASGAAGTQVPAELQAPASDPSRRVLAIDAGHSHGLALRQDGSVVSWGQDLSGETAVPPDLLLPASSSSERVVAISAGTYADIAVRADGTVVEWGWTSADGYWNGTGWQQGGEHLERGFERVTAIAAGQLVHYVVGVDGTAPALTLPNDIVMAVPRSSVSASVTYPAVAASDPDDAVSSLACTATASNGGTQYPVSTSGGVFSVGTSTVTCVAADSHGNESSQSFAVTVSRPPDPASISILPPDAVRDVGTIHSVLVTVRDANSNPSSEVTVLIQVSGASTIEASCTTDAAGQCSYSYRGPPLPGADMITATADSNSNRGVDAGEPSTSATVAWQAPAPSYGQVNGAGQIENASHSDALAFGFTARSDSGGIRGDGTVIDPATGTRISITNVTSLVRNSTQATIFGSATINGVSTTFRIDVEDVADPGRRGDTFAIRTASGYVAYGALRGGNIQIR